MIQRKTQTAEYWHSFSLSSSDIDFLRNHLLDAGQPPTTGELAEALIAEHARREEAELRTDLARGTLYQPAHRYAVGDALIFPALDYRLGKVTEVRAGENPEYGDFDVITVDFGADRRLRSFAARLDAPHKLNAELSDALLFGDSAGSQQLLTTTAGHLPDMLRQQLSQEPGFAVFEDRWLLADLLADVNAGHVNIAEALIEMRGAPVDTDTLLQEMDLPAEIDRKVLAFSLHRALAADGRFDQVGPGDEHRWHLRRLEAPEALEIPTCLRHRTIPFDAAQLDGSLLRLAYELDDEWSEDLAGDGEARAATATATLLLIYPHLASGTLPLNRHARPFFPAGHGERTMVTLIDGRWGNRFPAWVNHAGRCIAGLRPWFEKHKLPAGAFITLERRDESGEVVVDFRPKRMRREWTRWAQAGADGRLDVQLRKQEVACEYDEQVIIGGEEKHGELLELQTGPIYAGMPLGDLVFGVFTDLAGLSQSGSVHAKTIYSTVNVLRRCPPEPILAALASDPRLEQADGVSFRLVI